MTPQQIEAMKMALEAYLCREMPAGTIIGDPKWWVPKIAMAIKEALAQPERHELQAKAEHPAPCARHCEANAFQIVIKNLKAQLAQPEQEQLRFEVDGEMLTASQMMGVELFNFQQATGCDTAAEFLAQPEQEPVAWADLNALSEQINSVNCGTVYRLPSEAENRQPLYTHPPKRKPLTDEEIMDACDSTGWIAPQSVAIDLARAIEAAHGIKENT